MNLSVFEKKNYHSSKGHSFFLIKKKYGFLFCLSLDEMVYITFN